MPIQEWLDDRRTNAEINQEIQSMNNLKAEIWGTRRPVTKTKATGWTTGDIHESGEDDEENYLKSDFIRIKANTKYRIVVNGMDRAVKVAYYNDRKTLVGIREYKTSEIDTMDATYARIVLSRDFVLIGDERYIETLDVLLLASMTNYGFDSDVPNDEHIANCMIRLDLWSGSTSKADLVGKVGISVDVWKGDHIKIKTSGTETGSRGIDDSPVGKDWDLVVQNVRIFGKTKELQLKYA